MGHGEEDLMAHHEDHLEEEWIDRHHVEMDLGDVVHHQGDHRLEDECLLIVVRLLAHGDEVQCHQAIRVAHGGTIW